MSNGSAPALKPSGAIFGLFGTLLTPLLLRDRRIAEIRQLVLINVAIFVGINLFLGSTSRGIDNAAHVGGLTTGVVLGLAIFFSKPAEAVGTLKVAD
jgi:rhomboid protease GluP